MIGCKRESNNGPASLERGMMHASSSLDGVWVFFGISPRKSEDN